MPWKFLSFALVLLMLTGVGLPVAAQLPGEEPETSLPLLRLAVVDLKVQGEREPEVVQGAFTAVLPAMTECLAAASERVGKIPHRITVRFNLGSSGKVVWCKVIDPPLKTLEACLCKALTKIQLPPLGDSISRVTVLLESRQDHLLTP